MNLFCFSETAMDGTIYICCPLCSNSFRKAKALQSHLRLKHPVIGPKQWNQIRNSICQKCNKFFESPDGFVTHRQEVHTIFKCDICNKSLSTEISLNYHRNSHSSKERKYKCNVSGVYFLCYTN